jgi:hypothetical protein
MVLMNLLNQAVQTTMLSDQKDTTQVDLSCFVPLFRRGRIAGK